MARYKINSNYVVNDANRGVIFSGLKKALLPLLNENSYGIPGITPKEQYVRVNSDLEDCLHSMWFDGDKILTLIGYTGMGKTAALLHYVYSRDLPGFINGYLIIPCYYSNSPIISEVGLKNYLCEKLNYGIDSLITEFSLNKTELCDEFQKKRYFSIAQTTYYLDRFKKEELIICGSDEQDGLSDGMTFYLTMLKHILNKLSTSNLKGIYFVVDDVESLPIKIETIAFDLHIRIHRIMATTDYDAVRNYYIKTLIAVRPYIIRYAYNIETVKRHMLSMDSPYVEQFHLVRIPTLKEIVERRIMLMVQKEQLSIDEEAIKLVKLLLNTIEQQIHKIDGWGIADDFMLAIHHHNIRSALKSYYRILACSKLQVGSINQGAFGKMSINDFYVSPATVIRALAYGENSVYKYMPVADGKYEKSHIPNLLYNTEEKGRDLLSLLLIAYMYGKQQDDCGKDSAFHMYTGVEDRENLLKTLTNLMPSYFDSSAIEERINYFLRSRIFMKCINEPEDIEESNYPIDSNSFFLSPRGVALYKMLGEFSILLEIYRDDMWIDHGLLSVETERMKQTEKFLACISIVSALLREEASLINRLQNQGHAKVIEYAKLFGKELQTYRLAKGIKRSLARMPEYKEQEDIESKVQQLLNDVVKVQDGFVPLAI